MKSWAVIVGTVLGLVAAGVAVAQDADLGTQAKDLARSLHIVDTHIDVPYRLEEGWSDVTRATDDGDFDYPRAVAGGLNTPFMSIYTPASKEVKDEAYELAHRLIDSVEALAGRAPQKFVMAYSVADALEAKRSGKIGLALGMENGAPIGGKLERLQIFYDRGIRYITLAHSGSNHIADSSYDDIRIWNGVSPFGRQVVAEMNRLGMMVDISHVSDEAFFQVLELSEAPLIASHSSARHFTPGFERNMSDDMIRALGEHGGVIMINFGSAFLTAEANAYSTRWGDEVRDPWLKEYSLESDGPEAKELEQRFREANPYPYAALNDVADHIDHVVAVAGVDHVGIGSDYDGVGDSLPEGLKDVSSYPALIEELLRREYSEADIRKIMGENLLRVWLAVEAHASGERAHSAMP